MAKLLGGTRIYGNLIIDTNVAVNGTNVAISNTTGAIVAAGGIGLAGNIYAGGNIVLNSTGATVTQVWASANDSAAQPGYAWSGDTTAGMFQAAANTIGFTTVGVERARITNIGNLLVGTTATTLGSNSTVVISGLGTNGGGIELVGGGQSGGGNISALSGGGINFGTFTGAVGAEAYTERARFVPNGNLLIGTRVNPAGGNATVVIQGVGTNGGGAEFVGASGSGGGNISALSGGGLTFSTFTGAVGSEVYTDRMRLNTTSNILINTALNPLGGNATVVVSGLGTNGGGIELVGGGQTGGGNISAMTAGGMTFGTFTGVVGAESYAERMRIEPTGNVGIGTTTSSNARVTIDTANAGVGTGTIALLLQTRQGGTGTYVDLAAATYNGYTSATSSTIRFIDDNNFSNNIAFRTKLGGAATNADVERMRIYSTGNIGIGTSTAPLGGNATVVIDGVGTNGGGIELVGGSASGGANISGMSAGGLTISTFTGLVGAEVYTNRMIVNNAGNLLINTALNPLGGNATVVVGGIGTNGGGIELVGSTTGGGNISGMGNGGLTISTFTGAVGSEVYTNRMVVNNAGNLLINTALNPLGGNATVVVGGIGTNGGGIELVGGGASGGGNISALAAGGLTVGTFTGAVGAESYAERMRVNSVGNVIIGMNTSSNVSILDKGKLTVAGGQAGTNQASAALLTPGYYNGERADLALWSTFNATPADSGPRRTADVIAGFNAGAWGNEYLSFNVGNGGVANDAATVTIERMRIASNGNLLIGTSTIPLGGNATVVVSGLGTNGGGIELVGGGQTGGGNISAMTAGGMTFGTFTGVVGAEVYAERMRLAANGKFLVGTTVAPVGAATNLFLNASTGGGVQFGNNNTSGSNISVGFGNGIVFSSYTGVGGSETYTQRAMISGLTGNLLIGTATLPAGGNATVVIAGLGTNGGGIELVGSTTGGGNISGMGNGGLTFSTFTGAVGSEVYADRMRITALGNVGIGTATVGTGNTVAVFGGNIYVGSTNSGIVFPDGTYQSTAYGTSTSGVTSFAAGTTGMTPAAATTGAVTLAFGTSATAQGIYSPTTNQIALSTASTARLLINANGNVLVGTTTAPAGSNATVVIASTGTNGGGIELVGSTTGGGNISAMTGGGLTVSTFTGAVGSEVYTNRMVVNNAGNLLINTALNPLGGNATVVIAGLGTNGGGAEYVGGGGSGGGNVSGLGNGGLVWSTFTGAVGAEAYTERMRLSASGTFGIATAAPLSTLDVNGVISARTAFSTAGSAAVASVTSNGTVTGTAFVPSSATIPTNGIFLPAADTVGVAAGSTERMRVTTTGVGIGGAQQSSFNVTVNGGALGTVANSQVRMLNIYATDTNASSLEFSDVRNASGGADWTTAGMRMQQKIDATYMGWVGFNNGNTVTTNNGGISFGTGTSTLGPNGVPEVMRITSTGTVGIATVAPGSTLDVNGVISARTAFSTAGAATVASLTSNGSIGGTTATLSNATGPQITFTGATSQWVQWPATGIGAPTFTTSSVGTKLLLNPFVAAAAADYAIGIESNTMWFGVPTTSPQQFKWYGGTTQAMLLSGAGALTTTSTATSTAFIPSGATIPTNGMFLPAANTLGFATNSTEDMRLAPNGNLLVGLTTLPAGGNATVVLEGLGTNGGGIELLGGSASGGGLVSGLSAGGMAFATFTGAPGSEVYTEQARFVTNGNLLLGGTTLPAGGNATVVVDGVGTNGGGIELLGGSASGGGLVSGLSAGGMAFATFTGAPGSEVYTERMRIDVNGNVGIATTNAPTGNIFAVYGRSFHAGNVQIANTTVGGAGIFFPDGSYQSTAATGSGGVTSFSGGTTGFTPSVLTTGPITLAGTLIAANGGTGFSTYVVGDLLYASTTTVLSRLAAVATGQVIVSAGAGTAPTYSSTPTLGSLTLNTAAGPQLTFSGATSNFINFGTVGDGAPAFTTRSAGTKAVYDSNITAISADYAVGVVNASATAPLSTAPGTLWHSVPAANILHQFQWYGGTTVLATLWGNGNLAVTGEMTAYFSDSRLKDNIAVISDAVDKVKQIRGVYYHASDAAVELLGEDKTVQKVGLLAQEVEAVLPNVIRPAPFDVGSDGLSKSGENYLTLQYERVIPLLVQAIKEQQTQIEAQQVQIDSLLARITRLEPKP